MYDRGGRQALAGPVILSPGSVALVAELGLVILAMQALGRSAAIIHLAHVTFLLRVLLCGVMRGLLAPHSNR